MATRGKNRRRSGGAHRRRLRPIALLIAVVTAAALVWWGVVSTDGGIGRFWAADGDAHAGGAHGEITDKERRQLDDLLESIDRDKGGAE